MNAPPVSVPSTEEGLLAYLSSDDPACYDDDTPRLAYADLLQEKDDPLARDRAEFIRLQCAHAREPRCRKPYPRKKSIACYIRLSHLEPHRWCEVCQRRHRIKVLINACAIEWLKQPCPDCGGRGYERKVGAVTYVCPSCQRVGDVGGLLRRFNLGIGLIPAWTHAEWLYLHQWRRGFPYSVTARWNHVHDADGPTPAAVNVVRRWPTVRAFNLQGIEPRSADASTPTELFRYDNDDNRVPSYDWDAANLGAGLFQFVWEWSSPAARRAGSRDARWVEFDTREAALDVLGAAFYWYVRDYSDGARKLQEGT